MSGKRSKRIKFQSVLIIRLIEDTCQKLNAPVENSGFTEVTRSINNLAEDNDNLITISDLYIRNRYNDAIDKKNGQIGLDEDYANTIARFLGYQDIYDYQQKAADTPLKIQHQRPELKVHPPEFNPKFNTYYLQARLMPGLIIFVFLQSILVNITNAFELEPQVSKLSFWVALLVGGIGGGQFSSIISKVFQHRLFTSRKGFPSTYYMLFENAKYPRDVKHVFRDKVKNLFGLKLLTEEEEIQNPQEAIKLINTAIQEIVSIVNSPKIFAANIRYGFTRNTLGALLIILPLAIVGFTISYLNDQTLPLIGSSLWMGISAIILMFWRPILRSTAESYAQQLLFEFLNKVY